MKNSKMDEKKRVVVVGAGLGGLAIANRLQSRGFAVSLVEKNPRVGGHAYPLHKKGYTFDMGPSLITAPDIIRAVFQQAGARLEDFIELVPLDPFYRIYYHDHTYLDYTFDTDRMKEQMARFNPKDAARYDDFMKVSKKIYEAVIVEGMGSKPFFDWGTMLSFMPRALKLGALWPAYYFAGRYFKDFRHRFAFSFHPLFIGGNPFRAPAVYQMIPYLEKIGGVLYSRGGMYSLVQALEKLFLRQGGRLLTDTPAEEIIVRDGRAVAVRTRQGMMPADLVVSNADFIHTYRDLINPQNRQKWHNKRLERLDYSMSAFIIFLGLKRQYPQLLHHTLILSHRYRGLIYDIFKNKVLADDFSMYLHAPTRTEAQMAPPGCESLYVLIPVPNLQGGQDWTQLAEPFAEKVIDFLQHSFGLEQLRQNIEVMEIFTPLSFEKKQNACYGSAWGVEPHLLQTAIFRPHNRSEDIGNLYVVGASTHPGAGLPGVFLTAETTERVILNDMKMEQR
ncbi:phytoene desaturase [candidate division KSB1 bacterium]|nr:phytoene desaturase [candidate division KSB1 bacterium]